MAYVDDLREYRKLAKRVNQRLVRLERLASSGVKSAKRYAYAAAQNDITGFRGEGFTRWNENPKGLDYKDLGMAISSMNRFLQMPSSVTAYYHVTNVQQATSVIRRATGQNISPVDVRRAATLNKEMKTDFTPEQYQKFMETGGLYDKLLTQFGYREAFKAGAVIMQNLSERKKNVSKRQILESLKQVTLSDVDISDKDAKAKIKRIMRQKGKLGE